MSDSVNPIGGPDDGPIGSASLESIAPQLVAPTTGQVLGASFAQAFAQNPTVAAARAVPGFLGSVHGTGQIDPATGDEAQTPDPIVPKDTLNKEFGIPGVLTFDQDTTAAVAQQLHDHHVAEIQRDDILQRNVSSVATGGLARFLAGTAASIADPLNVAAALVPGAPEARVAAMLGDAAQGVAGRMAVRAITGASQGILGTAALQPLEYGLARAEHDDWDMGSALSSVLFGGVIGGVLHSGLGIIEDGRGLPEWGQQIAAAPRDLQESMTRGAIASIVEDQPRPLDQLLSIHDDLKNMQDEMQSLQAGGFRSLGADDLAAGADLRGQIADATSNGGAADLVAADGTRTPLSIDDETGNVQHAFNLHDVDVNGAVQNEGARVDIAPSPDEISERIADVRQRMQDAGQRAEAVAAAQRPAAVDPEMQRQMAQRLATVPEITGDPVKDLAAAKTYDQEFNAFVNGEKALGRWGDADDRAVQRIDAEQADSEGYAKAFQAAARCIVGAV